MSKAKALEILEQRIRNADNEAKNHALIFANNPAKEEERHKAIQENRIAIALQGAYEIVAENC